MEDPGMTVRLVHSQSRSRHFRLGTSQITTRVTIFCQTHLINIICSEERVLSYIVSEWLIGFFWHERLNICLFEDQLREATKNGKKFHTCCELWGGSANLQQNYTPLPFSLVFALNLRMLRGIGRGPQFVLLGRLQLSLLIKPNQTYKWRQRNQSA